MLIELQEKLIMGLEFYFCMHLIAERQILFPIMSLLEDLSLVDSIEVEPRFDYLPRFFQLDIEDARVGLVRDFDLYRRACRKTNKDDQNNR